MKKIETKSYSFIILAIYIISLAPSFISHQHSNTHNHNHDNKLSYCEDTTEDQHLDCSHEQHLKEIKEKCLLCDYCAIYNDIFLVDITVSKNILSIDNSSQYFDSLCFQGFRTYSNKSPPLLT